MNGVAKSALFPFRASNLRGSFDIALRVHNNRFVSSGSPQFLFPICSCQIANPADSQEVSSAQKAGKEEVRYAQT